MRCGRLREPITLTARGSTQDAAGHYLPGPAYSAWGEIVTQTASDAANGAAIRTAATMQIRIRYRAALDTTWTLTHAGVTYAVVAVTPDPRRTEMILALRRTA